jgi:hypothetical protein
MSVCLSVRLSVFSQGLKTMSQQPSSAVLTQLFVINQVLNLSYVGCLDIRKPNYIYWFHYMNHQFSHKYFLYFSTS